jgi:very-short-patch-repair endonuclease
MTPPIDHSAFWPLVRRQHGVISRAQMNALRYSDDAIRHRLRRGRLMRLWPGIYAVGRLAPTHQGLWMGAILAAGPDAALSHHSAAAMWAIHPTGRRLEGAGLDPIHVSVPVDRRLRLEGITAHRRKQMPPTTTHESIPVTQPLFTLVDLAGELDDRPLEAAINEADKLGLIRPRRAAKALAGSPRTPGIGRLERLLGLHKRTDSDLERHFLRLVRKAGLPEPKTQKRVNGHRADFYWPELGLVVETDGGAYHRTPTQQLRDRRRDQAHLKAGLTAVRFTDIQIDDHPDEVVEMLEALARKHQ